MVGVYLISCLEARREQIGRRISALILCLIEGLDLMDSRMGEEGQQMPLWSMKLVTFLFC